MSRDRETTETSVDWQWPGEEGGGRRGRGSGGATTVSWVSAFLTRLGKAEKPPRCAREAGELRFVRTPSSRGCPTDARAGHAVLGLVMTPTPGACPQASVVRWCKWPGCVPSLPEGQPAPCSHRDRARKRTRCVWPWALQGLGSVGRTDPSERPGASPQPPSLRKEQQ